MFRTNLYTKKFYFQRIFDSPVQQIGYFITRCEGSMPQNRGSTKACQKKLASPSFEYRGFQPPYTQADYLRRSDSGFYCRATLRGTAAAAAAALFMKFHGICTAIFSETRRSDFNEFHRTSITKNILEVNFDEEPYIIAATDFPFGNRSRRINIRATAEIFFFVIIL